MRARLEKLTFESSLGSMADRSRRIAQVADAVVAMVDLGAGDRETTNRAGQLAKFDLGFQMVVEMISLAGTMAGHYARHAGEPAAVALALEEMERPRSSDDAIATSVPGAVLAAADPTGSSDPFALPSG